MNTSLFTNGYDFQTDNLDIDSLSKVLQSFFKFKENRDSLKRIPDPLSLKKIEQLYDQQDYISKNDVIIEYIKKNIQSISPDFLFRKSLIKISKGQVLEHSDCINTYHSILAAIEIGRKAEIPFSSELDSRVLTKTFKNVLRQCELIFDFKSHSLITYKHPKLKEIDKKITLLQKEIRTKLAQISTKWSNDELLQQSNYDIFEDKFVLPVRSDRFTSSLGRIIYRSKGGGTLYVEPFPLKEITNQLEETRAQLEREVYKILKAICDEFHSATKDIEILFNYLILCDNVVGRHLTAQSLELTRPSFNDTKQFRFDQIFHPLIEDPIKNDLILNKSGMLISGPNTGGKTVLLKSICLCLILPHHGLFVPAKDCELYYTSDLYFMSHDNQSLQDGLSSFSSEALSYISTVENLKEESIVFIDEIFNTTSSYEASLLACALIKHINSIGALTFISSHHETLKENVYNEKLLESAHMGFKKGMSTPTYILHQGSPGRSFAREVFVRLEGQHCDSPIISQWLEEEDHENKILGDTIQNIDEIKEAARNQLQKNKALELQLQKEKEKVDNLLLLEKQRLESEYEQRWKTLKKETLDLTEKIKKGEIKNVIKVTENLNKLSQDKNDTHPDRRPIVPLKKGPMIGDFVLINKLGVQGTIKKLKGTKAFVEAGKIKTWVPFDELSIGDNSGNKNRERIRVNVLKNSGKRNMQLDARGMRRDEFLKEAEFHILDVINGDLPFVDVIHGHGDGVLKKSLYSLIRKFEDDLSYDFVEGNMGTTRIELKR